MLEGSYRRAARLFGGAEAARTAADAAVLSNEPEAVEELDLMELLRAVQVYRRAGHKAQLPGRPVGPHNAPRRL